MALALTVDDLRGQARRRLPRAVFEYVDRGAYDERTMADNRDVFARVRFRQRVMVDVDRRKLATTVAGQACAMPVVLGPTGLTGLVHADGEIHACRAAQSEGVPYCLSTASICSIEDVREAVDAPFWFQLYMMRDRGFVRSLVERARDAGCPVLVLTVDLAVQGQRHRDIRNGLSVPLRPSLRNAWDLVTHPAWAASVLMGRRRTFGNFSGHQGMGNDVGAIARWIGEQFDASMHWGDLEWLRALWPGKLIVKGVLDAADARMAARLGADGVVVSNHGGRQLDGAPATLAALPAVVEAVEGRCEVHLDGGVRSGQDVAKALALGATSAWLGRAFLYGLGAGGGAGVRRALEIIRRELDVTLALLGRRDVRDIDAACLHGAARDEDLPEPQLASAAVDDKVTCES
jgi:L-lactate dehydrogenase (cytochrome)